MFGKRLRSRQPDTQPSTRKESEGEKAEFQGFQLRRTTSQEPKEKGQQGGGGGGGEGGAGGHDFGVRLKVRGREGGKEGGVKRGLGEVGGSVCVWGGG